MVNFRQRARHAVVSLGFVASLCGLVRGSSDNPYNETQKYGESCKGTYLDADRFNQIYDEKGSGNNCLPGYSCGPKILKEPCYFFCVPDLEFIHWNESDGFNCSCPSSMLGTGPDCRDFKAQRYVELIFEILPSFYSGYMTWYFTSSLRRSLRESRAAKHKGSVWNPKVICLLFGSIALWSYTIVYPIKVVVQMVAYPVELNQWLTNKTLPFMLFYLLIAATTTFSGLANVVVGLTWLETYAKVRRMKTNSKTSFRWIRIFVSFYTVGALFINTALVFSRRPSWVEFFGFINCIVIIPTYIYGAYKLGKLLRELAGKMDKSSSSNAGGFQRSASESVGEESQSASGSPPLRPSVSRKVSRKGSKMLKAFTSASVAKRRKRVKRYDKVAIQARSVTKAARRVVIIAILFILFAMWAAIYAIQCLAGGGDVFCGLYIGQRFAAKMLAVLGLHVIFRYFERGRYIRRQGKSSNGGFTSATGSEAVSTRGGFAPVEEGDEAEASVNIEMSKVEALSLSPAADEQASSPQSGSEARDQFSVTIHERIEKKAGHSRDRTLSAASTPGVIDEMAKGIKPPKKTSR